MYMNSVHTSDTEYWNQKDCLTATSRVKPCVFVGLLSKEVPRDDQGSIVNQQDVIK